MINPARPITLRPTLPKCGRVLALFGEQLLPVREVRARVERLAGRAGEHPAAFLPELGRRLTLSVSLGAVLCNRAAGSSGGPVTHQPLRDFVSAVSSLVGARRAVAGLRLAATRPASDSPSRALPGPFGILHVPC